MDTTANRQEGCSGPRPRLSTEAVSHLEEGVSLLLSRWSALRLAVENEWGGRQSAEKVHLIAADVFSWLSQSKEPLYIDDLEDMLDGAMVSLFNTEVEDGSVEEVAEKIMIMHEECLEGNYKTIEKLRAEGSLQKVVSHVRQVSDEEKDDDDESMGDDNSSDILVDVLQQQPTLIPVEVQADEPRPAPPSAEAEDGWTVVSSRRNRGKRN